MYPLLTLIMAPLGGLHKYLESILGESLPRPNVSPDLYLNIK